MIAADRPLTARVDAPATRRPSPNGHAPLVSVVIPTHNRAPLIGRAIGSALGQTVHDIEIIVVDDGSLDETADVVADIDDGRVRYLRLSRRSGGARARNAGIGEARAEWVAFLDSDDEWLPEKLEVQLAQTASGDDAIVPCGAYRQDDDGPRPVQLRQDLPEGEVLHSLLLPPGTPDNHSVWLTTSALMARRRALLDVGGFDETLPSFQEIDLLLRFARDAHRVAPLTERLMIKHDHLMGRIGTDAVAKLCGFLRVTRGWRQFVVGRLGPAPYERWVSTRGERIRAMHARRVEELASDSERGDALRYAFAMAPHASWGRRYLLQALGVALSPRRTSARAGVLND